MSLHHMLRAAVQQQAAGPSDPYFYDVTLLLTGNGTNGAQNNTFLDSSTNNFTITRNGNTTQGTFSPYGNLWSNYFDGSGDYLTAASNAAFGVGTGDFTVEAWVYPTAAWASGGFNSLLQIAGTGIYFGQNSAGFGLRQSGTANIISYGTSPTLNTWTHVAICRSGTTVTMYYNGASVATATSSANFSDGSAWIGADASPDNYYTGYMSNLRLVKGTALYTSNFTPSATPLTAVSGTSLLTCQSNRFIDNSSNNFTLTVNGNTSVQRFSPFNPTAPYSASTIGGSGYFDGSGDELRTPSITVGTQAFCYECWLYPTATQPGSPGGPGLFVGASANALQLSYYGANLGLGIAQKAVAWQVNNSNGIIPTVGQWNHVAFVRSGTGTNQTSIFLNGVRIANGTVSYNYAASVYAFSIIDGDFGGYIGYMSGSRFILGSTPYDATQSTITIPTAPPTPITNTTLLLNYTNAGIPDAAMMNDLETVGNAQVSTSVKKYGTGSLAFDGTGDYLTMPASVNLDMGSGDFTIEGWVYANSFANYRALISLANNASSGFCAIRLRVNSSGNLELYMSNDGANWAASGTTSSGISATTWAHIAIVKYGSGSNNVKVYINGTSVLSLTHTGTLYASGGYYIGTVFSSSAAGEYFNGNIDDLRITKGYARYTTNFTPPTAALPVY